MYIVVEIRVSQGKEPPCFLNLFKSHMIVHLGKRDQISTANKRWCVRLFMVRNELADETYLAEVEVKAENLRSRTSFVLTDFEKSHLFIWHGCKSAAHSRQCIRQLVESIQHRYGTLLVITRSSFVCSLLLGKQYF